MSGQYVSLYVGTGRTTVITKITSIWFLACVFPNVYFKLSRLVCFISTIVTFEWFLSRVYIQMSFHVATVVCVIVTNVTDVVV